MDGDFSPGYVSHLTDYTAPARRILDIQGPEGDIPWFEDGPWDPWNHVESAMALTAIGAHEAARRAFDYLTETQRPDGAWLGDYGNALPMVDRDYISRETAPALLDTNFCAYPAVGVLHYLMATGDKAQARRWWPMVQAGIDFVIGMQREDGTISWAFEAVGTDQDDALLAGNASIAKSLESALRLAEQMGKPSPRWQAAHQALTRALKGPLERFDRLGTGQRFAMDWYYPALSGALPDHHAQQRLKTGWQQFVHPELGCRCVCDEPWVTVAETCELAMALLAAGKRAQAEAMLATTDPVRDDKGVFWMGWQYEEETVWPKEQPSWTQAAAILAADALHGKRPHSRLLITPGL